MLSLDEKYPRALLFRNHFSGQQAFYTFRYRIVPIEVSHYKIDIFGLNLKI